MWLQLKEIKLIMSNSISLIIPTLNAGSEIDNLLNLLSAQSVVPEEILIVDSASDDKTVSLVQKHEDVRIIGINRKDFNHGLTRDMALRESTGDIVCFMTQDAVPANNKYVENLVTPILTDNEVAISSGRQLPKSDARRFEQLVRAFNYTETPYIRSKEDVSRLGIKTYFATDVCAAYRRSQYLELGGFGKTNMSEDMLMAAKAINAGYKVAYAADAEVYHSHNLTLKEQYRRNYAIGVFLETNKDVVKCESEVGEGSKLVKSVSKSLISEGNITELFAFGFDCAARLLGNRAGRRSARRTE